MYNRDLGASLYKTWTEEQRREEIGKLVEGYRSGLPVGILCKMAETIAGSQAVAKEYLATFMTIDERQAAVDGETGGMHELVSSYML